MYLSTVNLRIVHPAHSVCVCVRRTMVCVRRIKRGGATIGATLTIIAYIDLMSGSGFGAHFTYAHGDISIVSRTHTAIVTHTHTSIVHVLCTTSTRV